LALGIEDGGGLLALRDALYKAAGGFVIRTGKGVRSFRLEASMKSRILSHRNAAS